MTRSVTNICGQGRLKKLTVKHAEGVNGEPGRDVVIVEDWPRECPICWYSFKKGWTGIQTHWKAHHKDICSYEKAWKIIQVMDERSKGGRVEKSRESLFVSKGEWMLETFRK